MKILTKFSTLQRGRASCQPSYLLGPELTHPECCCEDRLGTEPREKGAASPLLYKESQGQSENCNENKEILTLFLK